MNNIDTLILSGGGPSGVAYLGIFKALFEKNIINKNLDGIKEIITTSAGILFSILYILNISNESREKLIYEMDIFSFLDIENIKIDNLLIDFGLFDNQKIGDGINSFIKHTLNINNITLKELYNKIPIKLTVKVFNTTKEISEYINHETDPNLQLSLLAQMTTAIPCFFKPVEYNIIDT